MFRDTQRPSRPLPSSFAVDSNLASPRFKLTTRNVPGHPGAFAASYVVDHRPGILDVALLRLRFLGSFSSEATISRSARDAFILLRAPKRPWIVFQAAAPQAIYTRGGANTTETKRRNQLFSLVRFSRKFSSMNAFNQCVMQR
jgi:hypothetical protein